MSEAKVNVSFDGEHYLPARVDWKPMIPEIVPNEFDLQWMRTQAFIREQIIKLFSLSSQELGLDARIVEGRIAEVDHEG